MTQPPEIRAKPRTAEPRTARPRTARPRRTRSRMVNPLTTAEEKRVTRMVNAIFRRQLTIVLKVICFYYLILFIGHLFLLPDPLKVPLMASAAGAILISLYGLYRLDRRKVRPQDAHATFIPAGGMILLNVYLHIFLTGEQLQLTNAALSIMAFGFIVLNWRTYLLLSGTAGFLYILALAQMPGGETAHFAFLFVASVLLSFVAFWQRLRTMRAEVSLTMLNRARAQELLELNKKIIETAEKAETANTAKSMFLANTTHELQTPMTGIMGMLDLLHESPLSHEQRLWLDAADIAADALYARISDLLVISDLEQGKLELQKNGFSPSVMLKSLLRLERASADAKGLPLKCDDFPPEDFRVVGDRGHISQIILHLIDNAIKYTDEGHVCVGLHMSAGPCGARLVFYVSDTGVGICRKDQERLFGSFERADASANARTVGAGLGLAICRQLADLMEGHIDIHSEPGKGSTISLHLSLPIEGEESLNTKIPDIPSASAKATEKHSLHILVAEDTALNRMLIGKLLQHPDWTIDFVENGKQAVAAVQAADWPYHLVLMDIRMPVMDGLQATKLIRSLENDRANIPIVALTANSSDSDRQQYQKAGMNSLVPKPIDPRHLRETVLKFTAGHTPSAPST